MLTQHGSEKPKKNLPRIAALLLGGAWSTQLAAAAVLLPAPQEEQEAEIEIDAKIEVAAAQSEKLHSLLAELEVLAEESGLASVNVSEDFMLHENHEHQEAGEEVEEHEDIIHHEGHEFPFVLSGQSGTPSALYWNGEGGWNSSGQHDFAIIHDSAEFPFSENFWT